ncbi:MAG: response regulator [Acidobacteria bacterium]|nr:response regulator [Acidobacteriota bacterium]
MRKILVVEDDLNLRRLYKTELEADGYAVSVAENGRQALESVTRERPDLVVMDIRMPEMDGLNAMVEILHAHKKVPIVLNTAYSCYMDDFLAWAADGYVIKSSDLAPLKTKIREVLAAREGGGPGR